MGYLEFSGINQSLPVFCPIRYKVCLLVKFVQHWESTLRTIQEVVPPTQFQRWFKQISFLHQKDQTITLGVPTPFHQDWLSTHYLDTLNRALTKHFGNSVQLEFEVLLEESNLEASTSPLLPVSPVAKPQLRVVEGGGAPDLAPGLPLSDLPIEEFAPQLPQFSGTFFDLEFNRLAYQYSELFVLGNTPSLNPLYIAGGVGMGKTHLLSFLGHQLVKQNPHLKIRYTNAEKFTNEMFKSWNDKSGPNYQKFYRDGVDILLFDDLQGLAGRKATQEALLHIYNEILSRGGRVVFTASVLPHKLGEFLEPLRSRIHSGVCSEIKQPSYDERVSLLSLLAQQNQIPVDETVLRILSDQGHRDIRELLGVFLRLHLQSRLEKTSLDSQFLAKEGVSFEPPSKAISLEEILALVENSFGISREELKSKSRKGIIAWARQVAMYLSRRF